MIDNEQRPHREGEGAGADRGRSGAEGSAPGRLGDTVSEADREELRRELLIVLRNASLLFAVAEADRVVDGPHTDRDRLVADVAAMLEAADAVVLDTLTTSHAELLRRRAVPGPARTVDPAAAARWAATGSSRERERAG